MADKTIGELNAVTEAAIGSLTAAASLYDDMLIPVEHQGEARYMTGRQLKDYVQAIVQACMQGTKSAADQAAVGRAVP